MMARIGFKTTFDMAHRLPEHEGKCHNLHGHTYGIEIVLWGNAEDHGMVMDFYEVKCLIAGVLAEWDHAVALCSCDPLLQILRDSNLDICIVEMKDEPTVENMIEQIATEIRQRLVGLPMGMVSMRLFETPTCWAEL
jgi:6-pyruvoyltetrahydropterin/6-carboxytetrahydropterin synthase